MKKLFKRDMVFTILVLILIGLNVCYYIVPDYDANKALTFAIIVLITIIIRLYFVIDKNTKLINKLNNGSNNIS